MYPFSSFIKIASQFIGVEVVSDKTWAEKNHATTDYTSGFKITHEKDGWSVSVKGEYKIRAKSAKEIDEMIKNFREPNKTT